MLRSYALDGPIGGAGLLLMKVNSIEFLAHHSIHNLESRTIILTYNQVIISMEPRVSSAAVFYEKANQCR